MSPHYRIVGTCFTAAFVLAACAAEGPGGIPYSAHQSGETATGATMSTGGGSISGGTTPASSPAEEKVQRGNTPPGMDRDGHGPAAGAIIDPTGAATRTKPY